MMSRVDNSSFVIIIIRSLKNFNSQAGKLRTEFTSPIVKSTRPRLSDTTFFAHCRWTVCICNPPCQQSLLLSSWWRAGGEKVSLPESRQAFEVATAQTSGLVNLVFPCHKHPFIDKPLVITMPAEASAQLLGLGSKLYPSNIPSTLNKDLTWFMQSLSRVHWNQTSEKRALLAGGMSVTLSEWQVTDNNLVVTFCL